MRSSTPKVLHKVGGETLIGHVLTTLKKAGSQSICLVTAPGMDLVRDSLSSIDHAIQETPLGTAHAVLAAEKKISSYKKNILILCGDTPLITEETVSCVLKKGQDHDVVIGPAMDGGYYLIGTKNPLLYLFQNIDWSTEKVLSQTLDAIKANDHTVCLLEELSDIDNVDDLKAKTSFFNV